MDSPKILMVHNYSSWGGNLATVLALSEGLREKSLSVEMAFPHSEAYVSRFTDSGFAVHDFEVKSKFDLGAITRLSRIIKEGRFDIVHSHTRRADLFAGYAALSSSAKSVVTHHGQINLDGETFQFKNGLNEKIYNFILRTYYAANVAVSYEIAQELHEMCGVDKGRIRIIANGIDPTPFDTPPEKRDAARAKYGLTSDDVAIITVASLGRKGHKDLVAAAALLEPDYPQAKYLFAGTGFGREAIKAQINKASLTETVRLLGFVNDIPELLAAGDVFCLPTYSEGLSIAIMEAMAAGLPVVASDVGGNPELVFEGDGGYIFPARNPAALADALYPLFDDRELRIRMGERNRTRTRKLYTVDRMVENYAKLYSDLMS